MLSPMQLKKHIKTLTQAQREGMSHAQQVGMWLSLNQGVSGYKVIAEELNFTPAYIREVALKMKPSKNNDVEKALAKHGCPGFEEFACAARKGAA